MDEVLRTYKQRKFQSCLELINSIKESDDVVENFVLENCQLVCKSLISMQENDPDKIHEMQEEYNLFFEKIATYEISTTNSVLFQLKLTAAFNFMYWLLFYNDVELDTDEAEECLELVNKVLMTVLGKPVTLLTTSGTTERLLCNLKCLKTLFCDNEHKTTFLIIELVVIIIVYIINLKRTLIKECLGVVNLFIKESKKGVDSTEANEFLQIKPVSSHLFKFSLSGDGMSVSELNLGVIDCLHLLESTGLFLLEDFSGSLKSLQQNTDTSFKNLWKYLVVLNSFELENWKLCSGFLAKMSSDVLQKNLKARYHVMQGKLYCNERNHKEALKQFESALMLSPNFPVAYFHIGQEYGQMGLTDLMVENFVKLVQALQIEDSEENSEEDFKVNFETTLLDWIHPADEITETEAHYALAVAYGLSESFRESAESFEKVLQSPPDCQRGKRKRIIELPNFLTVLHDASIMNVLHGNLVRAEQIALDAIDRYTPQRPEDCIQFVTLHCSDSEWLQRIIEQELLEIDLEPKKFSSEPFYTEDLIFCFPQNAIGLLILSEIQRIQEIEDYSSTISNVFSMFFKYIASMNKKESLNEYEKRVLKLVKALTGKTCVRIALIQMKEENQSDVEKMLKRALSCNKGDKDALYEYYKFLLKTGERREASKLWNTFSKEKVAIEMDSLKSFSLRYFLSDKITKRELDNIQREKDSSDMISFAL